MEKDSQKMQQQYMEMQMINQQMNQIQQQIQMIEAQLIEVETTKNALRDLQKTKIGSEILAPVSNGIFIKATLSDNEKLRVNVGSGTVVEKSIPEVIKIIEEQESEIRKAESQMSAELEKLTTKALEIEQALK